MSLPPAPTQTYQEASLHVQYLSFIQSTLEYASNAYVHSIHATEYNALVGMRPFSLTFRSHPTALLI